MMNLLKKHYFSHQNYTLIYSHHLFHNISSAAIYVFTGSYFLTLGMPLHFVLLFYGLEFGVRGFLCPFGIALLNRVGLVKAQIISAIFFMLFFVGISFAKDNLFIGFFSLFLSAMGGAIYYPLIDVLEALYVEENHNRTKQMSLGRVLGSLGKVIGAASVGFLVVHYNFNYVLILVTTTMALSILPFLRLKDVSKQAIHKTPKQVFQFIASEDFRPWWKPVFGEQLTIIVRVVMAPIFIYTVVGKLDVMGYLIGLALIAEKIFSLIAGYYTDKKGVKNILEKASYNYALAMAGYIFLAKTPLSAFLVESYHKTVFNVYNVAFRSGMHAHARDKHPKQILLFGAAWQMSLCFGELLVLSIYSLLAYFMGIDVFYVTCVVAVFGMWLLKGHFKK